MNYAIMLSGGTGTRTGADIPKQYARVNGHMMITYALKPILASGHVDKICIVCADEWCDEIIKDAESSGLDAEKIVGFTQAGDTRQLSILNGLRYILHMNTTECKDDSRSEDSPDTVIIHDAARPFLAEDLIDRCYRALSEDGDTEGIMPVLPMKDTVYLSKDGKDISGLIDRSSVFAGQAPELFRLEPYYEANVRLLPADILKINGASEPAVMAGMRIRMIPGDERNAKVTSAKDLEKFISDSSVKST